VFPDAPDETFDGKKLGRRFYSLPTNFASPDIENRISSGPLRASGDKYQAFDETLTEEFIGLDVWEQRLIRRVPARSQMSVRSMPSTTGNVVEWEGIVEQVFENSFSARLVALKGTNNNYDEYTTIELSDVQPGDRGLVEVGSVFRLLVGTQALGGTRQQFWNIVFRRLPAWNRRSVEEAQDQIMSLFEKIKWEDGETSGAK
jgi:hypothetical protein